MIKCFFKYVFHLKNLLYQFLKSLWSLGKLIRRYGTFIPLFYKNVNEKGQTKIYIWTYFEL